MITDEQIRQLQRKWVYVLYGNENDVHGLIPFARELIALAQQVKPLEFKQHGHRIYATTNFGDYFVEETMEGHAYEFESDESELVYDTEEEAIEAANEDYQRRVLSCLVNGGME